MKKYENTGKGFGVFVGGKTYDFPRALVTEVPADLIERIEDHISKLKDVTPPPTVKTMDPFGKIKLVPKEEWDKMQAKKIKSGSTVESGPKPEEPKDPEEGATYTEEELEAMTFSELRAIGDLIDVKFRSKAEGVREILEAQE